ncbi:MAG: DUF1684 domain-containing protein [Acidobacteria bacterium]|nr:MAG: DUF1684 domain-containing protein [Acidobacteriota bacterium]
MRVVMIVTAAVFLAQAAGCRQADPPSADVPAESANAPMPSDPYEAEIARFRQDRENTLKSDTGWLTIGGLFFLTQPVTTFGSDPLNDIVFPETAPARAGTFEVRDGPVTVKAAEGVTFMLDGKPFTSGELKPDVPGPADRLSLGEHLQFWVHSSGGRLSIRLRDQNNSLRKEFVGLSWFPVNAAYRVEATYTPYDKPKVVDVPTILGDIETAPIPGIVSFRLNGQEYRLEPFAEPGDEQFWFVFRDLTSQKETYPAARFLYAPAPVNGKMLLDFNRTVNPPCAYNPYTTCPIPSEQNRLRTRIEAGEKRYAKGT